VREALPERELVPSWKKKLKGTPRAPDFPNLAFAGQPAPPKVGNPHPEASRTAHCVEGDLGACGRNWGSRQLSGKRRGGIDLLSRGCAPTGFQADEAAGCVSAFPSLSLCLRTGANTGRLPAGSPWSLSSSSRGGREGLPSAKIHPRRRRVRDSRPREARMNVLLI